MVMAGADGNAETVSRQWVTAGIVDVLGVAPIAMTHRRRGLELRKVQELPGGRVSLTYDIG
jgi:hypothetical protein